LDKSEPVSTPAAEIPERPAGFGGWLAANLLPLAFVGAVIGVIIWRDLDIVPVALAVLGLGLVIFIHELGHFLAAKLCDVHVETFSIGFGKAIPGCQFRRGETLYKIGWIPLGGYVKMVGEGENADTEEADEDPRSFKNKSVWGRMFIISAGVVMNLILGCICFMVAYQHGVEETPAVVGSVGVGSPAWQSDLRSGTQILQIDTITRPTFDDIRPEVMGAAKGEGVFFRVRDVDSSERETHLVPRRNPEDLYPLVGINPVRKLVLPKTRKGDPTAVHSGSSADKARATQDGSPFHGEDKIVGIAGDPNRPADITPISAGGMVEFDRALFRMCGRPITVQVDRGGAVLDFVVPPAWTQHLPGVRFQMGKLAAVRSSGPAARAIPVGAPAEPELDVARFEAPGSGDRIIAVEVAEGNGRRRFVEEVSPMPEPGVTEQPFNPLRLGYDLEKWAENASDRTVRVTVLRAATPTAKSGRRTIFEMTWDPSLVNSGEISIGPSGPIAISGLGLAYFVDTTVDTVDPSAGSPLAKGDIVTEVRLPKLDKQGATSPGRWIKVKQYQAVYLHEIFQASPVPQIDLKVTRSNGAEAELSVTLSPDPNWAAVDRGFVFPYATQVQLADGPIEALGMGWHRTVRTVRVIYQTLYATIFRQISAETMSGPLTIANASYNIAGNDFWQFIIFIGLININLAVVNFLPIPLLDGGHMVFLLYEKIRGKPAPEKLQEWSMWGGLAFILLLMAFVIFLDVRKLFF
jgi:regulator of sigma E protease